jgi:hypothetical protein
MGQENMLWSWFLATQLLCQVNECEPSHIPSQGSVYSTDKILKIAKGSRCSQNAFNSRENLTFEIDRVGPQSINAGSFSSHSFKIYFS